MSQTIFITGTSSGLGKMTALHFAKLGWNVAAAMRNPDRDAASFADYSNVLAIKQDVTDVEQTRHAVRQAIEAFGRVDVVVNNAGMGSYGALELAAEETIDWQFAVNVRGPINVIRAFLPHFRANGGGKFINISSFMGLTTAVPLGSLYNMSKFALEGLTEGLYYELKPLGIDLHLVEQGGSTGNNFVKSIIWNTSETIDAYNDITARLQRIMANPDPDLLGDPQNIVDTIAELATGRSTAFRKYADDATRSLMAMRGSMPIEQYLAAISSSYH